MANVDSSRIYWYFFNLIFQYSAGKDIRIFHMRNIIRNKGKAALEEIDNVKREALRSTLKVEFWSMALRHGFMLYAYLFAGLKAILGAYLFAGLKAIRGIISIGGLTKYVGMLLLLQGQVSRLFSLLIRLRAHNTYLGSFSEISGDSSRRGAMSSSCGIRRGFTAGCGRLRQSTLSERVYANHLLYGKITDILADKQAGRKQINRQAESR